MHEFGLSAVFHTIAVRFYGCWWDLDGEKSVLYQNEAKVC